MPNFFNTPVNRISAFAMLLVWVFGLMSGVANACLLEAPGAATHAITATLPAKHHENHISLARHSQTEADLTHAEDEHTSKQSCLKACDDSSRSLTKAHPTGQMEPGLPFIVAVLWSLAEPIRLQYKQPVGTQYAPLLPLRVRYVKLAL